MASADADSEVVQLLLSNGADANIVGGQYGNAFEAVSLNGQLEIVRLLLSMGANGNARDESYDTALQAALALGKRGIWHCWYEYMMKAAHGSQMFP